MSKSVMEIHKNIEAKKQAEFAKRKDAMLAEVDKVSEKYRIDIVPVINVTPQGVYPLIAFVDVKEKYEAEAKAGEEAVAKPAESVPKLEV